jgi:hypothetical protein
MRLAGRNDPAPEGGGRPLRTVVGVEFVRPPMLGVDTTDAAAIQDLCDAVRRAGRVVSRVQPIRPSPDLNGATRADPGANGRRRPPSGAIVFSGHRWQ